MLNVLLFSVFCALTHFRSIGNFSEGAVDRPRAALTRKIMVTVSKVDRLDGQIDI